MTRFENTLAHYHNVLKQGYTEDSDLVDWSMPWVQEVSFQELLGPFNLEGLSILDVGCGVGSLIDYLVMEREVKEFEYRGIDIVPEMVDLARKKHPDYRFDCLNIFETELEDDYDIVLMSGTLGILEEGQSQLWRRFIDTLFPYTRIAMVFNMQSKYAYRQSFTYQLDNTRCYASPEEVFQYATFFTPYVNLIHHYFSHAFSVHMLRSSMAQSEVPSRTPLYGFDLVFSTNVMAVLEQGELKRGVSEFKDLVSEHLNGREMTVNSRYLNGKMEDWMWVFIVLDKLLVPNADAQAFDLVDELMPFMPRKELHAYFQGLRCHFSNQIAEAKPLLAEAVRSMPTFYSAQQALGQCLEALGELEEAKAVYRALLAEYPVAYVCLLRFVRLLVAHGETDEAVSLLRSYPRSDLTEELWELVLGQE